jgi:deoxyribodipyrimidine photo-lyase
VTPNSSRTALVWLRRDLRLRDNPALRHACDHADKVFLVYIHSPEEEGEWTHASASRWWLHYSLQALSDELKSMDGHLIIREGKSAATLHALIEETGATLVTWNRLYEPAAIARDAALKKELREQDIEVESCNGSSMAKNYPFACSLHFGANPLPN